MGTDCPGATQVIASGDLTSDGPLSVDRNGNWSQEFTVGEQWVGAGAVSAQCVENGPLGSLGALEVTYPSVPVTITTPFRLNVEPSGTVAPGGTLTVTSVGGGCLGIDMPVVDLEGPHSPPFPISPGAVYGQPANVFDQPVNPANWTLVLPIPADTAPGRYLVVGRCYYGRGYYSRTYQPAPVTVGLS